MLEDWRRRSRTPSSRSDAEPAAEPEGIGQGGSGREAGEEVKPPQEEGGIADGGEGGGGGVIEGEGGSTGPGHRDKGVVT